MVTKDQQEYFFTNNHTRQLLRAPETTKQATAIENSLINKRLSKIIQTLQNSEETIGWMLLIKSSHHRFSKVPFPVYLWCVPPASFPT